MVMLQVKLIPFTCPNCKSKLHYVNALNTNAEMLMVYCKNPKCRYCQDWTKDEV